MHALYIQIKLSWLKQLDRGGSPPLKFMAFLHILYHLCPWRRAVIDIISHDLLTNCRLFITLVLASTEAPMIVCVITQMSPFRKEDRKALYHLDILNLLLIAVLSRWNFHAVYSPWEMCPSLFSSLALTTPTILILLNVMTPVLQFALMLLRTIKTQLSGSLPSLNLSGYTWQRRKVPETHVPMAFSSGPL